MGDEERGDGGARSGGGGGSRSGTVMERHQDLGMRVVVMAAANVPRSAEDPNEKTLAAASCQREVALRERKEAGSSPQGQSGK